MKNFRFNIFLLSIFLLLSLKILGQVTVSIPDTTGKEDKRITIPINVSSLTNKNVRSYKFKLVFDPQILKVKRVNDKGTLTDSFGWNYNKDIHKGYVVVEASGWVPLKGSGSLINIVFEVVGEEGFSKLSFDYFRFNNGSPRTILSESDFWVENLKEIEFDKTGSGSGKIIVDGLPHNLPAKLELIKTKSYSIEAVPDEENTFVQWSGDFNSEDNPANLVISDDYKIFCEFTYKMFDVNVSIDPAEAGTVTGDGKYAEGEHANLSANVNHGWEFKGWFQNGSLLSENLIFSIVVNSNISLDAKFEKEIYSLDVLVTPSEGGTASGGGYYYYKDIADLAAIPHDGWEFTKWTKNNTELSSDPNLSLNVENNIIVTANFNRALYSLSLTSFPREGGATSGGGYFYFDETAAITAQPNNGWKFDYWMDGDSVISYDSTLTVTIKKDQDLIANFSQLTALDNNKSEFYKLVFENPYPNPFNPESKFNFSLAKSSKVTLTIFDVNGQLVQNLLENETLASGEYDLTFDAGNLPSGIYFYRYLVNETLSETMVVNSGKIILLK